MTLRQGIVTVLVLSALGWLIVTSADKQAASYEKLSDQYPESFCRDAAKLFIEDAMTQEQYSSYGCPLALISEVHTEQAD